VTCCGSRRADKTDPFATDPNAQIGRVGWRCAEKTPTTASRWAIYAPNNH
jgi:hypothetical protein